MLKEMKSATGRKTKLIEKIRLRLTISVILGIMTIAFAFHNYTPSTQQNITASGFSSQNSVQMLPPPEGNISNEYLIGAMDCALDLTYGNLSDLGLNVWHKYAGVDRYNDANSSGWDWYAQNPVDNLYNIYNTYSGVVTGRLGLNEQHNMRTLMQRPKIDQLAFGQRSDYQCEATNLNPDLWFYAFNNHDVTGQSGGDWQDNTQYGNNQWVRRCLVDPFDAPNGQGFVVRRLMTNSEQCNTRSPIGQTPGDNVYDWHIKPSIRADKNFIDNHVEDEICRVDVINYNESTIKSVILRAKHFKDTLGNYNGNYKDEFNFAPLVNQLIIQPVPPYTTNAFNPNDGGWAFNSRGNSPTDGSNKMDIKVYWYGTCNMWIDYVRVDNDVAHRLLKGNDLEFEQWLQWEASLGNTNNSPLKFYIEEFEFNHIPCMSYVSKKLKHYSGNENLSLMTMVNLQQYILHLPYEYVNNNRVSAEHISRYLIDSVGESQVLSEPYALTGVIAGTNYNDSKVPSTLPLSDYNTSEGRLGDSVAPAIYESWLQEHLDAAGTNIHTKKGQFTWYVKTMDTLSKMNNISYINMPQTHLWYTAGEEALREPTNEEMEMTTLLPVTYGAKGTLYFWYGGFGCLGTGNYARGLVNPLPCSTSNPFSGQQAPQPLSLNPRLTNAYGQQKWDKIKSINQKLTAWGPTLMSFDNANRHSYRYYDYNERYDLFDDSYFADLVTYFPHNGLQPCWEDGPGEDSPQGYQYDCKGARYVQVATFQKTEDDVNKYFMIVNRRCSPYINDNTIDNIGGKRLIKVRFYDNNGLLRNINNWTIYDVADLSARPIRFVVNSNQLASLGDFQPGEGKLYEMKPVIKSGGTLLADDTISGGQYECEDTIFNDGHNITISGNTSILFNDTSKIIVNGGSITIGDLETSNTVTLGSVTGNAWHGLELNNCEVRIYNTTFTGLANDTTYAINAIDCPVLDVRNCTFNINSNIKGGIKAVYYEDSEIDNIYIGGNTFNFSGSTLEAINVSGYAGMTTPLIVENNTISEGNIAILLSGITGGAVKSNALYENNIAISLLTSSVDVSGNTIYSEIDNAIGIFTACGVARLNRSASLRLGGLNDISNNGTGTNNIKVEDGYFIMDAGENLFNISDDQTSYHLSGMPSKKWTKN